MITLTEKTTETSLKNNSKVAPSDGQKRPASGHRRRNNRPWTIERFKVEPQEGRFRFHDFTLPPVLMRGIQDAGFEYCTPIQAASLPYTLNGHDIVGKAQTGTGKTCLLYTSPSPRD
mgnify:FL=1